MAAGKHTDAALSSTKMDIVQALIQIRAIKKLDKVREWKQFAIKQLQILCHHNVEPIRAGYGMR